MTAALLVATQGGHVSELAGLRPRLTSIDDCVWVTNDHAQTRTMLATEDVRFVPMVKSRDLLGVLRSIPHAVRLLRSRRFDQVVSTGSALALAYLPTAAALRIPAHYVESCTRVSAPSVTGRLLAKVPGVTTWWQHDDPPSGWQTLQGIFAPFERGSVAPRPINKIVVTVGTTGYSFRRLVDQLMTVIPADVEVFWQLGATDVSDLDIEAHDVVDAEELKRRITEADVVVSHAGAGSLLQCLQAGHIPVYVPRLERFGEQVDDHQQELAEFAIQTNLAVVADASEITWSDLETAAQAAVVSSPVPPINLQQAS